MIDTDQLVDQVARGLAAETGGLVHLLAQENRLLRDEREEARGALIRLQDEVRTTDRRREVEMGEVLTRLTLLERNR